MAKTFKYHTPSLLKGIEIGERLKMNSIINGTRPTVEEADVERIDDTLYIKNATARLVGDVLEVT